MCIDADRDSSPWGGAYQLPHVLRDRYEKAIAYVAVTTPSGDESIGSAFHVGDGILVTARHVVEGNRINEIANATSSIGLPDIWYSRKGEKNPALRKGCETLIRGPLFHPDDKIDVAIVVLEGLDKTAVPLGFHLDDWLDNSLVLTEALVMGYPPIPFAKGPLLVAARAEVNAIADLRGVPHPRFVLSTMARGGFSGGPAISCYDFSLGVITDALCYNDQAPELGFLSALTVEPILDAMGFHDVLPKNVMASWELYGNESPFDLVK